MNKRSRRKLHRKYLVDVIYEISTSHFWRELLLLKTKEGEKIIIDSYSPTPEPHLKRLNRDLSRYKLKYSVSPVSINDVPSDWKGYEGCVFFKFQAVEFSDISEFSANNPDYI